MVTKNTTIYLLEWDWDDWSAVSEVSKCSYNEPVNFERDFVSAK